MADVKWNDVVASEKYQALPEEEKSKVRQRYFDNVISASPLYTNLPDSEKLSVQTRFFGEARPSMADRLVSEAKDFFITKPAEGAEVLRGAAADAISPSPDDIEAQAAATGEVPLAKIAARTAVDTVGEFVPITPSEWAFTILGGKAASMLSEAAPMLAEKFPTLFKIMRTRIGLPGKGAAEAVGGMADDAAAKVAAAVPEAPPAAPAPEIPPIIPPVEPVPPPAGAATAGLSPAVPPAPAAAAGAALPEGAVEKIVAAAPPAPAKDIFGQQLNKFNVTDDARSVFDETSKIFEKNIDASRRGKIDFAGTKKLADDLGMDAEDLIKRNKGQAFNAEQLEAAKGLAGRSLTDVMAAREAYAAAQTPENLLKLTGSIAKHAAVQESFLGARAEAGRALSILRKVTDPANVGAENLEKTLKIIGGGQGIPEEVAKRLGMIDPTDVAGLNKFIRTVVKAKTSDMVYEAWINGILSSPMTHVRNMLGNTLFMASKVPEKVARGLVDRGASIFTGRRTAYASEAVPEALGLMRGIAEGTRRFLYTAVRGGEGKIELNRIPAIPGKLGEALRVPTKLLTAEDEMAKAIVTKMELGAQGLRIARREGLKGTDLIRRAAELEANPTDEMLEATTKEALDRTFQNPSKVAERFGALRDIPGVRYILPFVETPVNIAGRAIERSPVGFFKALHSGLTGKGQEQVVKETGQALYGSAIAATVAYNTLLGKVTGAPPREANARDRFFRSKLPYAIKIGDTWHSYASFEPVSMIVGATADAVLKSMESNEQDDATLTNVAGAVSSSIGRYLVSRTFLSGVRDFIEAMSDGERFGDAFIKRMAGGTVPYSGMMRYIAYQMDPVVRETAGAMDQIKSGIPGKSKELPARLDVYGDEIRRPTGALAASAIPTKREIPNPLDSEDEEIDRISGFPAKTIAGVKLRDDEYHEVLRVSGQIFKEARTAIQQTEGWKDTPAETRKSVINKLAEATRKEARAKIYFRVLDRLPDGDRRDNLIEYGVENLGIRPDEISARAVGK